MRSFPDGKCFQFTVVNPACVMGPLLSKLVEPGRIELHRQLMEHKVKRVPNFNIPIIDVRDVATAIVNALTAEGAANKRHLLSTDNIWYTQTAQILADEFSRYGYDVTTKRASSMYLLFNGMFDKQCRKWRTIIDKDFKIDNTRMKTVLGVKPRSINTTIIDMGYSMIDTGLVKKPKNYTARASGESCLRGVHTIQRASNIESNLVAETRLPNVIVRLKSNWRRIHCFRRQNVIGHVCF